VSAISQDGVAVLHKSDLSKVPRPVRSDLDLIERVDQALDVLHGKWKVHLLFFMARGVRRHGRLLACLPGVSKKVMTDTLRRSSVTASSRGESSRRSPSGSSTR